MNSKPTRQEKAEAKRLQPLKEKVQAANKALAVESRRHEAAVAKIRKRMHKLRQECTHPIIDEQRDPSGNGDHAYECMVCFGMMTRRANEWRVM